jgi:hypothetical protein
MHMNGRGALIALALAGVLGCGRAGPKTYPVSGKIELAAGDVKQLAGSHIEAVLDSDPSVRSSGEIKEDGTFALETLHAGVILRGAREGSYRARIILTDEDRAAKRLAAQALSTRFRSVETSGLVFQVPAENDVTLSVSQR